MNGFAAHPLLRKDVKTQAVIHSASGRCLCCSSGCDPSDALLDIGDFAKNSFSTVHVIDGPKDASCFTKVGQCQLQICQLPVQIIRSIFPG